MLPMRKMLCLALLATLAGCGTSGGVFNRDRPDEFAGLGGFGQQCRRQRGLMMIEIVEHRALDARLPAVFRHQIMRASAQPVKAQGFTQREVAVRHTLDGHFMLACDFDDIGRR